MVQDGVRPNGLLKRGLNGIYQHVSEQHLQRTVTEFDFRYNNRETCVLAKDGKNKWKMTGPNDAQRADIALKGISGKRLMYAATSQREIGG